MTYILGLTGSIGMGKSTTAQMFRDLGIPVWDADAAVHALYQKDGAAIAPLRSLAPMAVLDGAVDRKVLKSEIRKNPDLLKQIEAVVHPLVAADRQAFIVAHRDDPLLVLDIPLLFETGGDASVDGSLVVTTDSETQKNRVLARPGMTEDAFKTLLSRQMPDAEKRAHADFIIETNTLDQTKADVAALVEKLLGASDA